MRRAPQGALGDDSAAVDEMAYLVIAVEECFLGQARREDPLAALGDLAGVETAASVAEGLAVRCEEPEADASREHARAMVGADLVAARRLRANALAGEEPGGGVESQTTGERLESGRASAWYR